MATTKKTSIQKWDTIHNNGPFASKLLLETKNEKSRVIPGAMDRYNDTALEIQRLLQEAIDQREGFRAFGSRWSLSNIAHHPDRVHFNAGMNLKFDPRPQDCHHASPYQETNLFFVQCGNTIKEISEFIAKKGKSLKTSGASNGQTIAGCISTGVHGSALDVGSVQDYVVGINLIIGPKPKDNIYLERHTRPALADAYIKQFNARIIRNDDLFNSALVGLGAFGFIHGVVVEAEDQFLLQRYVKKIPKKEALKLATTLNFEGTTAFLKDEKDAFGKGLRPYHFKIFVNPYHDDGEFVVELIYKKPFKDSYPDPLPKVKKAIYTDLITLFIKIAQRRPKKIPKLIKALSKGTAIMPRVDSKTLGTLKETFWDAQHKGPAFACAVGVDHKDAAKALQVLSKLTQQNPIPGIYAMRFVKASEATLAFTKFSTTCMIEIDGVNWEAKGRIISLNTFCRRMLEVLEANNIAYTIHWGKNANWSKPNLLSDMYGSKALDWLNHRSALLTKKMAQVFSNDFLKTIQLNAFDGSQPRDLVHNLGLDGSRVA